MSALLHDLSFAWRSARKRPASSLLIVITLALGIGANSAIFSMTWQVLLAPLPYADGDALVKVEQHAPASGLADFSWSGPTIADLRAQQNVFEDVAGYLQLPFTVAGGVEPQQVSAGVVSWNFPAMLGMQAATGRAFAASDDIDGAAPVLLLGDGFWREAFGADPDVVGSTLLIKDVAFTVVGVLPPMPPWPHANDIWIPMASDPYRLYAWTDGYEARDGSWTALVVGRLREGLEATRAQEEMTATAARLAAAHPDDYPESYELRLVPLREAIVGNSRLTFRMLSGLTALVALIAGANVAGLSMASLTARNQELAIREAVGASPGRIARQVLSENLLLTGVGCLLAVVLAYPVLRLLRDFALQFTPLASNIGMNATAIGCALLVALALWLMSASHLLFGGRDINRALKEGGDKATASASTAWGRQALLMLQFALAFVVLCSATLMVTSLLRLNDQHAGYDAEQVVAASLMIDVDFGDRDQSAAPYETVTPYYGSFSRTLLRELRAVPGIIEAGLLAGVPLLQNFSYLGAVTFDIEGRSFPWPDDRAKAPYHAVTEGFFEALRIPLLQGRLFDAGDDQNSLPVALINESFALAYFPQGDALGQRIRFVGDDTWRTIVGVVGDLRSEGLDRVEGAKAYYNYWQYPTEVVTVYAKTAQSPQVVGGLVGNIVRGIQPRQSVDSVAPLEAIESQWLAPLGLRTLLIALSGVLALVVTLAGVVGVVANSVGQRVREIGVHMALGADPREVTGLFVFQGLRTYACGIALGLALALPLAPLLEPMLYETSAFDPAILAAVVLPLTLVVLLAIYLPARKAGALSPMEALHAE